MFDSVLRQMTETATLKQAICIMINELHIARRHWNAYPAGHPMVQGALQKLLVSCRNLLALQSMLTIGITRDGLLFGDDYLDKGNQSCRAVAAVLFERGVGALLFRELPAQDDLIALLRVIGMKREAILAAGGVDELWRQTGATALELRGIRYDRFSGTEETLLSVIPDDTDDHQGNDLWERFIQLLMQGPVGLGTTEQGETRPEVLAASLNALFAQRLGAGSGLSFSGIRPSLTAMEAIVTDPAGIIGTGGTDRGTGTAPVPLTGAQAGLAAFIAALDPALRRQFLDGFCETATDDHPAAEGFFRHLGQAMLQETYATAEQYAAAPELLKGILRTLAPQMAARYETSSEEAEIRDKVRILLQEHRQETYVPEDYLIGLQDLISGHPLQQINPALIREQMATLETTAIESRSSEIILQLVVADPNGENIPELIRNLSELCGYFLELGEYGQVLRILSQAAAPQVAPSVRRALRDAFSQREFLEEILSGLTIWGKAKYDQVGQLIQIIGRPFIEPLLDRLAEEDAMSLRRFMMDRLLAFGDAARPALVDRLADSRWYVLRNIIVMLRSLAPGQEIDQLRPLLRHANQKVRQEALRSLLLAGDPMAQRQLLRDLESNDRELQLAALNLIDRTGSTPELARKLVQLLTTGGYSPVECELKSACIQALAEIGRPEVLPELIKLLSARSLLTFKALSRLKVDLVRSLERYPPHAVLPLLEQLARGSDELAQLATEQLHTLRSGQA